MEFLVEDGTGMDDATSLCSVATADDYATQHPQGAAWLALDPGTGDTPTKEAHLMRATRYVRLAYSGIPLALWRRSLFEVDQANELGLRRGLYLDRWVGAPAVQGQALPFPRVGLVTTNGDELPSDEVPLDIQHLVAHIAIDMAADAGAIDLALGGVQSETVGPTSVTYAGSAAQIRQTTFSRPALLLAKPYLKPGTPVISEAA